MGGAHLHTPQSIFQHMMGQQNAPQQAGPWLQMPQVPQLSMPWSVSALQQPDLIRFTGERNQPGFRPMLHQKRKLHAPDIADTRQAKQFITEEKMAAHFEGLHISSNHNSQNPIPSTSSTSGEPQPMGSNALTCNDLDMEGGEPVDIEQCATTQPRLVISEELRRIQEEPMLPTSLLSKLERPTMALVLWEPPSKHLRVLPTPRDTPPSALNSFGENNNNNNNDSITDLNQSSSSDSSLSALEPMDL